MSLVELPQVKYVYQNYILDSTKWDVFEPRNDDIVIATYQKAGTTWTQGIVSQLITQSMAYHDIESSDGLGVASSIWPDLRFNDPGELTERLNAQSHRRFLKTHLPLDGLPFYPEVRYLVIGRDARDIFMSLWNHYSSFSDDLYELFVQVSDSVGAPFPRCPEDIHDFWKMWINQGWFEWEEEGYPFWGNMHHAQTWWNYRHLDNIQFFHYADMLADPQGEIRRMANFLNIEISDEELPAVIQKTSLSTMRQVRHPDQAFFKDGTNPFFNKGTNGRWRDVLSEDELAMYETTKSKVLSSACAQWLEQGRTALS